MRLVEQSHEVLKFDDEKVIEVAGRTCYKSEDKITDDSANKFIKGLIKRGHGAMLEHAGATVKLVTNRGVTHELVRHRVASFAQESTRYVNYKEGIEFIKPVWLDVECMEYTMCDVLDFSGTEKARFIFPLCMAEDYYKSLLKEDLWKPEQAREVLPNALKTEIVVTANYREWIHIFNLRVLGTTGRPHPQIEALLAPVLQEFAERCPAIFGEMWEKYNETN